MAPAAADCDANVLGPLVPPTPTAELPGSATVRGAHVQLERLTDAHSEPLYASVGVHDNLWIYTGDGPFRDADTFVKTMSRFREKGVLYGIMCDGAPQGVVSLGPTSLEDRVVEMGVLFSPRLQRSRAATEATYLVLRHSFDDLHFRRVEWKTDACNKASIVAAERLGFVYEGRLRQHRIVKGRNRDTAWLSMIDAEWPRCKRALEAWLDDGNFDAEGRQRKSLADIRNSV